MNRRSFLLTTALAASTVSLRAMGISPMHIATNVYPWMTFARRRQREWDDDVAGGIAAVAESGIEGFEPVGTSPQQIRDLAPLLNAHGIEMRSLYVNSVLHEAAAAEQSIADVLAIATAAGALGTRIIVTNPSPIRWGGPENKTDAQLGTQAKALNDLGAALHQQGLTLAYHNHDIEMREGAREFHHMLTGTDPAHVKLCLDAHWIFRGCGNSQVALFDAVHLYHDRIVELHLRQSRDGVWTETFTMDGDIDYRRLFGQLTGWGIQPHFVLEQAVEASSPDTMEAVEAHRISRQNLAAAWR